MRKFIKKQLIYVNYILAGFLLLADVSVFISPGSFWPAAFFGLAFPFLMAFNLLFFIYWIVIRKKYFLVSLIALLLSLNNIHNTIQLPKAGKEKSAGKNTLKILTYNVQIFNLLGRNTYGEHQELLFSFIRKENPDIICFQEFYTNKEKKLSLKKVDHILKEYEYRHVEWIIQGSNSNYGIAVYSKYPIINKMRLSFQNTNNTTIFSDIVMPSDTVRLFNNHLQSIRFGRENYRFITNQSEYSQSEKFREIQDISVRLRDAFIKRAEQANHLKNEIGRSPYPVIICGDFNDTPVSYTYRKIKGDLKDSFLEAGEGFGSTYEGKFPSYRIDYVLHSEEIETLFYETKKIQLSDHYPVIAVLKIK